MSQFFQNDLIHFLFKMTKFFKHEWVTRRPRIDPFFFIFFFFRKAKSPSFLINTFWPYYLKSLALPSIKVKVELLRWRVKLIHSFFSNRVLFFFSLVLNQAFQIAPNFYLTAKKKRIFCLIYAKISYINYFRLLKAYQHLYICAGPTNGFWRC